MHTQQPDFPFVCVLTSGGSYHSQHVQNQLAGLRRCQPPLVCLTDLPYVDPGVEVVSLQHQLPGWFSKLAILGSGFITGCIQDRFPTLAGSWRQTLHYRMGVIADVPSILVFHGQPKPQDLRLLGPRRVALFPWAILPHALVHRLRRLFQPAG